MGLFSTQTLEQVASANDIVTVIGSYLPLKRAGSAFTALCPFHREKHASFHVNPQRQMFHCFGCDAKGGVFKFVQLYENIEFPAAVRRLAERAGIVLVEEESTGEDARRGRLRRRLLGLHAEAADWFHRNLMKADWAAHAREYLRKRGLSAEVATSWKLGYAPESWDACSSWALSRGYTVGELLESGLVKTSDDPSGEAASASQSTHFYDRFRDRLMFPICNDIGEGEVIAFSGRVLSADAENVAKYLNSPETPLFTKGNVLFGLHKTKRAIIAAKSAIVCEGQIDLISAFEAGVRHVIAPQGTAFTGQQATILKRHADEAVLCFDADTAGQKAAERSFATLLAAGVSVRVATMPPGEDPDSFIRARGAEAFLARIAAASDFFDFQLERASRLFDLATARGQAQACRLLAESVALLRDPVLRGAVIGRVTTRLGVAADTFRTLLRQIKPRSTTFHPSDADLTGGSGGPAPDAPQESPAAPPFVPPSNTVAWLLRSALTNEAARSWLLEQANWPQLLGQTQGGEILYKALAAEDLTPGNAASVNAFLAGLPPDEEAYLSANLLEAHPDHPLEEVQKWWRQLEHAAFVRRRTLLQARLREPGLPDADVLALQKEVVDLQKRLVDIARL